jgi:arginine exporter protein ArgO
MTRRSIFGDAVLLVFILAQVADGVFTYIGIATFGTLIEGNPLLAWYIAMFGAGTAVIGAKSFAVACASTLHLRAMHRTIGVLAIIYLVAAVLPWSRMLIAVALP